MHAIGVTAPKRFAGRIIIAAGTVAAAVLPAGAALAAGWSAPAQVAKSFLSYDIGIDAAGDVIASWDYYAKGNYQALPVSTRTKPASGVFQPAQLIPPSRKQLATSGNVASPKMHLADSGVSTVVYENNVGVWTADKQPGQAWQPAIRITSAGTQADSTFRTKFNSAGDGVIAWEAADGALYVAQRPAGGAWSAPILITQPQQPGAGETQGGTLPRDVSVAEDGSAVVAWEYYDVRNHSLLNYRLSAASVASLKLRSWSLSGTLLGPDSTTHGGVAAAAVNRLAAVAGFDGGTQLVEFAQTGSSGVWSAPTVISPAGYNFSFNDGLGHATPSNEYTTTFATDASGHATLLCVDGNSNTLFAIEGNLAANDWAAPVAVSNAGAVQPNSPYYQGFSVGVAADGFRAVGWWTAGTGQNLYLVTQAGAGSAFSSPVLLGHTSSSLPASVAIAAADGQKAVAAWTDYNRAGTADPILASTFGN